MEEGGIVDTGAGRSMVYWVSLEKWGEVGEGTGDRDPGHCDPMATQAILSFTF